MKRSFTAVAAGLTLATLFATSGCVVHDRWGYRHGYYDRGYYGDHHYRSGRIERGPRYYRDHDRHWERDHDDRWERHHYRR